MVYSGKPSTGCYLCRRRKIKVGVAFNLVSTQFQSSTSTNLERLHDGNIVRRSTAWVQKLRDIRATMSRIPSADCASGQIACVEEMEIVASVSP